MSDDLVKPTPEQVADALESWCPCKATNDICQQHIACSHQAHGARAIREQSYRIEELEAKLAKTVERLDKLSRWLDLDDEELANLPIETLPEDHRHIQKQVNAALAELEGADQ